MMERYALQKSAPFAIARYTVDVCKDLAQCWIDKDSFMLEQWVGAAEDPGFDMRSALRAFVEGAPFARVDACGNELALKRLQGIRSVAPKDVSAVLR